MHLSFEQHHTGKASENKKMLAHLKQDSVMGNVQPLRLTTQEKIDPAMSRSRFKLQMY
ncbi:MAG: hypothetical protein U0640_02910 [Phycisphaerales bacterium]